LESPTKDFVRASYGSTTSIAEEQSALTGCSKTS
jgi:hypothetical protein